MSHVNGLIISHTPMKPPKKATNSTPKIPERLQCVVMHPIVWESICSQFRTKASALEDVI